MLKNGRIEKMISLKDGVIVLPLRQGEEAVLFSGDEVPSLIVQPIPIDPEQHNYWGVKAKSK